MIEYTVKTFTIGFNTPGYLPEMEPYVVQGEEAARQAMWDELDRDSDHIGDERAAVLDHDPDANEDGWLDLLGQIDHAKTDVKTADISQGWDAFIRISDPSSHDLGTHYWITPGGVVEEDE